MTQEDIANYWNELPWEILPPSSKVDFCQFIAGIKPVVRTLVKDNNNLLRAYRQISNLGWYCIYDKKGFIVISRDNESSRLVMEVDQSPSPHAIQLGQLLGYPQCCSAFIEKVGEEGIDKIADSFNRNNLSGPNIVLDISKYLKGIALISHVPCSKSCGDSLSNAKQTLAFINLHKKFPGFAHWALCIEDYFSHSYDAS